MEKQNIRVKISGLNLLRIINKAADASILIENLKIKAKYIEFEIKQRDYGVLFKICKQEHKRITILTHGVVKRLINCLTYSLGVIVALSILFSYFYVYSKVVYSVEIISSNEEARMLTENYLNSNGISIGNPVKISIKELEKNIISNISQISGCSVRIDGGMLKVYIYSGEDKKSDPDYIRSNYNAVISKINIFAGKTSFCIGDVVKKGDILIFNDNGCSGEFVGKVVCSSKVIYNEKQQIYEKTGKYFERNNVIMFNKYSLNNKILVPFSTYSTEKCVFYKLQNYFIPLKIEKQRYYETKIVETTIPFESVQNEIKMQALNEAKEKINDENSITNVTYSCVRFDDYVVVDCFVEFETKLFL